MIGNASRATAAALFLALAGRAWAGENPPEVAGFERLKALAGEWVATEDGPMTRKGELAARYAVSAGGSAVVETVFPGSPHEMVTVYHLDGSDVVLTHYCMGNQPRMRARDAKAERLDFAYDGGTNIDPGRDRHMHSARLEFLGRDEIRSEWTQHAAGKVGLVVTSRLARKAR
jgi:hypothetical protein